MYFDTHTHVNFAAYKDDAQDVILRALDQQTWMINVGTQSATSAQSVAMAQKFPTGVFAAIGLHPVHTWQQMLDEEESHFKSRAEVFIAEDYEKLLDKKVVAVGECGLDYFRLPQEFKEDAIKKQKEAFISQIKFAKKHGLPVIIHCRDLPATPASGLARRAGAYEDVLEILKSDYVGGFGVIHSFTDTWETAKKFIDIGFYVALNGILTFDKTGKLAEVAQNIPIDRLLIETDAPYLTPPPYRGKRNEPSYVKYVAEKVAVVRNMKAEEVGQITYENACKLFRIKT